MFCIQQWGSSLGFTLYSGHTMGIGVLDDFHGYHSWFQIQGDWEDKMCQKTDKKKGFKVGSLLDTASITSEHPSPWKIIWKSKAPPRVSFFVWTVALGVDFFTIDNLRERKVRIKNCAICVNAMVNLLITFCSTALLLQICGQ